jgi:GT2 family glycosyltransferase
MYLRSRGEVLVDYAAVALHLRAGNGSAAWAVFDTYVNAFAPDKWKTYTRLGNVALKVRLRGTCRISLYAVDARNRESMSASHLLQSEAKAQDFIMPFPDSDAVLWFWDMTSDDCTLLSASYVTDVPMESLNPVRLAVIICTFRREQYARALLEATARSVEAGACAAEELRLYLVDNGRTLDESVCIRPYMKLIPNRNAGGSGGFARGMLEITDDTEFQATHILLMDDDIELPEGVLHKTFSILRLLKYEYASACIGGAMLDMRQKNIHVASIETTDGIFFLRNVLGSNIDMNDRKNILQCIKNRKLKDQYQGWWHFVLPVDLYMQLGLPYPCFFQGDDIEYCMRTSMHIVPFLGIFVWHEPFTIKEDNAKLFFIFRNYLIISELHPEKRWPIYRYLVRILLFNILRFNYGGISIMSPAIQYFLEGPKQIQRPEVYDELLHKIKLYNDDIVDITNYMTFKKDNTGMLKLPLWRKVIMVLTLNGHFLPNFCLNEIAYVDQHRQCSEFSIIYLRKILCYEADLPGYGFIRTRSMKILVRETIHLAHILVLFICKRNEVGRQYRATFSSLTSTSFLRFA